MFNFKILFSFILFCLSPLIAMDEALVHPRIKGLISENKSDQRRQRRHSFSGHKGDIPARFGESSDFSAKTLKEVLHNPDDIMLSAGLIFHRAIVVANMPLVQSLLAHDAEALIDFRNGAGETALHIAAALGHAQLIDILIEHGADCTVVDNLGNRPINMLSLANKSLESHFPK